MESMVRVGSGLWKCACGLLVALCCSASVSQDPDLEPGFPVQAWHGPGSYHGGPAIHALVGNIDSDPTLEIVVTALAQGPLYAWNHDGTPVSGWPVSGISGAGYPAMGNLSGDAALEVFSGHWGLPGQLVAYTGSGVLLSGWPRSSANFVSTPPALADVDGDGLDEIFIGEEDWQLHAYRADGTPLPGWPTTGFVGGQERHTPAIADLDGDGDLEIVSASGSSTLGVYLFAYHHDGTSVDGFPVLFPNNGFPDTFPAIGDVDGDGQLEIVFLGREPAPPWRPILSIVSGSGSVERQWLVDAQIFYGSAPALADLDGDGTPEVILQSNGALHVWYGDGTPFPGWPITWASNHWLGGSAPVVGDMDGDGQPDIVVTSQYAGNCALGEVRVYDRFGNLHPRFPKVLNIASGAVPAIADIDLDGRNEIIITGSYWCGISGFYDKVWAYDLRGPGPYGPIHWGQFGGGPRHQGLYLPPGEGVLPQSFTIIRGLLVSGGLPDLLDSDDSRLVVRTAVFAPSIDPPVQIEVVGTSPTETPSELRFRFEGMASRNLIERRISLYNYVTQSYEELHVAFAATSDEVVEIVVTSNASRFVEPGTGQLKSLMTWKAAAFSFFTGWNVGTDQTIWTITP